MISVSALLLLCCSRVLFPDALGYNVYRAVPRVTVVSDENRLIECPPYPKGYVLVGMFRKKDQRIQHRQVEQESEPACYHYEPLMAGESA
jgi:hypothetical protein